MCINEADRMNTHTTPILHFFHRNDLSLLLSLHFSIITYFPFFRWKVRAMVVSVEFVFFEFFRHAPNNYCLCIFTCFYYIFVNLTELRRVILTVLRSCLLTFAFFPASFVFLTNLFPTIWRFDCFLSFWWPRNCKNCFLGWRSFRFCVKFPKLSRRFY